MLTARPHAAAPTDPAAERKGAMRRLRLLCVGNEGVVRRERDLWSYHCTHAFVSELETLVGEVTWCAWTDSVDDTLKVAPLQDSSGRRAVGLPPFRGALTTKLANGVAATVRLTREVSRADFVYVYWPGRLSTVVTRLCRAIGKPYGIYLRGEQHSAGRAFRQAVGGARFVLATGRSLRLLAGAHCRDVEEVTPMTPLSARDVQAPTAERRPGPWRLLYVGRVEHRKGARDLLDALVLLHARGVSVELTMVGHSANRAALLRLLPEQVARQVHMVGAIGDFAALAPLYRDADAFVLASHDEGFPRVLYEAMALGVPILTTFVGGIADVMRDRENCLRIIAGDATDIAERIRELAESPALQHRIVWSSHHRIKEIMSTWSRSHAMQVAERMGDVVVTRA